VAHGVGVTRSWLPLFAWINGLAILAITRVSFVTLALVLGGSCLDAASIRAAWRWIGLAVINFAAGFAVSFVSVTTLAVTLAGPRKPTESIGVTATPIGEAAVNGNTNFSWALESFLAATGVTTWTEELTIGVPITREGILLAGIHNFKLVTIRLVAEVALARVCAGSSLGALGMRVTWWRSQLAVVNLFTVGAVASIPPSAGAFVGARANKVTIGIAVARASTAIVNGSAFDAIALVAGFAGASMSAWTSLIAHSVFRTWVLAAIINFGAVSAIASIACITQTRGDTWGHVGAFGVRITR